MMTPAEMKRKGTEELCKTAFKAPVCKWPAPSNALIMPSDGDEGVDYKAEFLAAMQQLDACYALLEILDNHGADNLLPAMLEGDYQQVLKEARQFMDSYMKGER
jgi:hypothetical protein